MSIDVVLDEPDVRLRYSSTDDAQYNAIERGLRKGDKITVWVAPGDEEDGNVLDTWQTDRNGEVLISYRDQVQVRGMNDAFWQDVGAVLVIGALVGAALVARRRVQAVLWNPASIPESDAGDPGSEATVALRRLRYVVMRFGLPVGIVALLVVIWILSAQAHRALELGVDGLAGGFLLLKGLLLVAPAFAAMPSTKETRLLDWHAGLGLGTWISIICLERVYFVPSALLVPMVGYPAAEFLPALLLLFSGPSIAGALFSSVYHLPPSRRARKRAIVAGSLLSFSTASAMGMIWRAAGTDYWLVFPLGCGGLAVLFGFLLFQASTKQMRSSLVRSALQSKRKRRTKQGRHWPA